LRGAAGELNVSHEYMELDSRPSDAINMAARFNAPIYVTKEAVAKAKNCLIPLYQMDEFLIKNESRDEIEASVSPLGGASTLTPTQQSICRRTWP